MLKKKLIVAFLKRTDNLKVVCNLRTIKSKIIIFFYAIFGTKEVESRRERKKSCNNYLVNRKFEFQRDG